MARTSMLLHEQVVQIVRDALGSSFMPRVCNCIHIFIHANLLLISVSIGVGT